MWKKVLLNRNRHSKTGPGSYSSVKCGKYSAAWGCAVIFMDTRVWSLPCPRFIHGFFRSKASANRKSSVRILALPMVKKRREPKSFLSRAKAQMDASFRGEALRGFLTFLPKGLLQAQLLRLFRVLGPAALAAAGAASTVLTAVPGGRDELAVFYLRTRLAKAYSHKKQDGPEAVFAPFSSAGLHLSERHCRTAGWYRVRSGPPGTPLRSRLHRRPVHFPLAMISSRLSAASFDKLINGLVQLLHRCGTAVFYGIYETVFDMIL